MFRRLLLLLVASALTHPAFAGSSCVDYADQIQLTEKGDWGVGYSTGAVTAANDAVFESVRSTDIGAFPTSYDTYVFDRDGLFLGVFASGGSETAFQGAAAAGTRWCGYVSTTLTVADITDPANVQLGGTTVPLGTITDVVTDGAYAYLSTQSPSQIVVVDLGNLLAPASVGSVPTAGDPVAVALDGGTLYVAEGTTGVTVVDVSTPSAPAVLTTVSLAHDAEKIAAADDLVHATGAGTLSILDVATPGTPIARGSLSVLGEEVAAYAGRVFLGAGFDGLEIVDVTNPDQPAAQGYVVKSGFSNSVEYVETDGDFLITNGLQGQFSGQFPNTWIYDVGPAIESAWVTRVHAPVARRLIARQPNLYVASAGLLDVYDVTDASSPALVGTASFFDESLNGLDVEGNLALVAWSASGGAGALQVIDVSDPTDPIVKGGEFGGPTFGVEYETFGYVTRQTGLDVIDVTFVNNPMVIGSWAGGVADKVAVDGDYAYVTMQQTDDLMIIDVSSPSSPVLAGQVTLASPTGDVILRWPFAYVATTSGVAVVNVQNPAAPFHTTTVGSMFALDLGMDASTLYVSSFVQTMAIDITNPGFPALIGPFPSGGGDVTVDGSVFVVSEGHVVVLDPQCAATTPVEPVPPIVGPASVRVHPSPTAAWATIRFAGLNGTVATARAWGVDGRRVADLPVVGDGVDLVARWDLRSVPAGVYFVRLDGTSGPTARIVRVD